MIKVLFVCLGNICRSPLAEVLFVEKVKQNGMDAHFKADSAGTSDYHIGELPDERTIACARKHGLSISHRGRQVNRTDFREFNYIVAMDEKNLKNLNQLKIRYGFKDKEIYLMRDFQPNADSASVPDPYYGGEDGFEAIYEILDEALDGFLAQIKEDHPQYV
ncbi:low molecular weight protein-tyrosine-phosphatase [Algoriphagus namhaensis]